MEQPIKFRLKEATWAPRWARLLPFCFKAAVRLTSSCTLPMHVAWCLPCWHSLADAALPEQQALVRGPPGALTWL